MRTESKWIREWATQNKIGRFLLDLDGTQCDTRPVFDQSKKIVAEMLVNHGGEDIDTWVKRIESADSKRYETNGVAIDSWILTTQELISVYELDPALSKPIVDAFANIYFTPVSLLTGAEEGLTIIQESGIPMSIVTHADEDWTWRKYDWLSLDRWYKKEDIYIVDARGHKNSTSWLDATKYFKNDPKECVTIGDSPRSDINPSLAIGILHCFLVEGNTWSAQHEDSTHDIVRIGSLLDIPGVLRDKVKVLNQA